MPITVLPQSIVNKIAAGEVIERPASVVKEVVENSIDAGADRIEVSLEQGGMKLIRIVDNGRGMGAEDLALAFTSHATSKLLTDDDLFRITTMGFRGEALASIGAVSEARIVSRTEDSDEGHEVEMRAGALAQVKACGAPVGTQLEVRNLFHNVPARRKFLKSPATEMAHITETLTRLALAHPETGFVLTHNDRKVFNLPPASSREQRIGEFFGREIAENIIPFCDTEPEPAIEGYLLPPSIDRANTNMQYTYVNLRYVRHRSLMHAIMEGYRGLMLPQRRPVCFILLTLDPGAVDVNVHPTKIEVKFRNGRQVYNRVLETIRSTLQGAKLTPQVAISPGGPRASPQAVETKESIQRALSDFFLQKGKADQRQGAEQFPRRALSSHQPARGPSGTVVPPPPGAWPYPERPRALGTCVQVLDSYIIEETEDGLNLIDQHALHERILYNRMKRQLEEATLASQQLLVPELVELTAPEFFAVTELMADLARFGMTVEPFGERTIIVRSFPQILRKFDGKSFFEDLFSEFEGPEGTRKVEERVEKLLKIMACRGAIKAGDRLSAEQILRLLEERAEPGQTDTCPHGRPTTILLTRQELEKQFRRT